MKHKTKYKGTVKGNAIILEEGVHLPEGIRVMVEIEQVEPLEEEGICEEFEERQVLVAQMKAFGQRLAGRHVNLGDLVLEGREELEAHFD